MRELIEDPWPELVHKLPPKKPHAWWNANSSSSAPQRAGRQAHGITTITTCSQMALLSGASSRQRRARRSAVDVVIGFRPAKCKYEIGKVRQSREVASQAVMLGKIIRPSLTSFAKCNGFPQKSTRRGKPKVKGNTKRLYKFQSEPIRPIQK
jgi:hypothetical protein